LANAEVPIGLGLGLGERREGGRRREGEVVNKSF